MGKALKITLSLVGIAILAAGGAIAVEAIMDKGNLNLMVRNMFAKNQDIPAPSWNGKTYENIPYSNISQSDYVDIYVPEREDGEKPPLFVMIHGGGFAEGTSQSRQSVLTYQDLRAAGYACASINYRLSGEAIYPAAIED